MIEPILMIEIEGKELIFIVDTGTMVSLIQPTISKAAMRSCGVQARGVTSTQLDILGEQHIQFGIKSHGDYVPFEHTIIVCNLKRCSSGILGMDFLQSVGAEISLPSQVLIIDQHNFPFVDRESGVPTGSRLARGDREGAALSCVGVGVESGEDWVRTVELAETVSLPPLSARIARCRVVRRDDPTDVQAPRKQLVMVDPEGLPGVYMARVFVTMNNDELSSTNTYGSSPSINKSPLVDTPLEEGNEEYTLQVGAGEPLSRVGGQSAKCCCCCL